MPPKPCASAATRASDGDCRCTCGSLLARIAEEGVELKCRRCKRTLLVPWSARDGFVPPRPAGRARPDEAAWT